MTHEDAQILWTKALEVLQTEVEEHSFRTWFAPMKVISATEHTISLEVNDKFVQQVLRSRWQLLIQNVITVAAEREYTVEILAEGDRPQSRGPTENMLNPKYTFDTFVVGASNRFAHAASLAVAEAPSDAYNPLFMYGGAGLGKTHLMHAIGHYVSRQTPARKLLYTTSENFMNQLIASIANKSGAEFRKNLRNVDILMIDDIQFIVGRTATQEEFFHTFNELHSNNKQIIITSDRPPSEIPTLEDRLRSRFEWGLIADIQKPDYETRIAILKRKVEIEGIEMGDEILHLIAERIESNIRLLEGALTRLSAKAVFDNRAIDLEIAEEELSKVLEPDRARRVDPALIMEVVCEYYRVTPNDMISPRRNREIALPRQIAMFLSRELTALSTTRIGDAFGNRDHTTVMHACGKISGMAKANSRMRQTLEELKDTVRHR